MQDEFEPETQITGVLYPNTVERRRFIALYRPYAGIDIARVILLGRPGMEQFEVWEAAQRATEPHEWADIRVCSYSAAKRLYGRLVRSYMRALESAQAS